MVGVFCFFFKQKTAYEMRISDWSSDVCSSDLRAPGGVAHYMGGAVEGTGRLRQGVGAAIVAILGHVEKADRQQQRHGHQQEYDQAAPRPTRQGSRLEGFVLTTFVHSPSPDPRKIGRAHVSTPVTNAHLVCRLLLATKTPHKYKLNTTS